LFDLDRDKQEEVDKAYNLFTGGTDGPITLAHLKRVARVINENVSEETLKDMLMEASTKDRMRVDRCVVYHWFIFTYNDLFLSLLLC